MKTVHRIHSHTIIPTSTTATNTTNTPSYTTSSKLEYKVSWSQAHAASANHNRAKMLGKLCVLQHFKVVGITLLFIQLIIASAEAKAAAPMPNPIALLSSGPRKALQSPKTLVGSASKAKMNAGLGGATKTIMARVFNSGNAEKVLSGIDSAKDFYEAVSSFISRAKDKKKAASNGDDEPAVTLEDHEIYECYPYLEQGSKCYSGCARHQGYKHDYCYTTSLGLGLNPSGAWALCTCRIPDFVRSWLAASKQRLMEHKNSENEQIVSAVQTADDLLIVIIALAVALSVIVLIQITTCFYCHCRSMSAASKVASEDDQAHAIVDKRSGCYPIRTISEVYSETTANLNDLEAGINKLQPQRPASLQPQRPASLPMVDSTDNQKKVRFHPDQNQKKICPVHPLPQASSQLVEAWPDEAEEESQEKSQESQEISQMM